MGTYFDNFPRIAYDISQTGHRHKDLITDIFFRFKFLDIIKRMKVAYFPYAIKSGETPEIIADKVYNDPQGHWVIMLLNDIVDPTLDWYMEENTFDKFIRDKYGSISEAYNTVHHYEKTTSTKIMGFRDDMNEVFVNTTSQIDGTDLFVDANTTFPEVYPTLQYAAYDQMANSAYEYATGASGRQIEIATLKGSVTCYDHEYKLNEKKQLIKLVYPPTYPQIRREFDTLVANYNPRRLSYRTVKV